MEKISATLVTPQVSWTSIQPGDKYHVPPLPLTEKPRMDIEIIYINNNYFTYKTSDCTVPSYAFKESELYKYMVKNRNFY